MLTAYESHCLKPLKKNLHSECTGCILKILCANNNNKSSHDEKKKKCFNREKGVEDQRYPDLPSSYFSFTDVNHIVGFIAKRSWP